MGRLIGGLFLPIVVLSLAIGALFFHPKTPLPPEWNPTTPFDPLAPVTRLTQWKLRYTLASPERCSAALSDIGATFTTLPDQNDSEICHIRTRTRLTGLPNSRIGPVETRCEMALRLALWSHHGLQPAAQEILGSPIARTYHFGSYSCRKIRGSSDRMSQHATANALDISGFDLADGRKIRLRNDWNGDPDRRKFLLAARRSACEWFRLVLSPDYNAAHHDHFHMDQGRWPSCR